MPPVDPFARLDALLGGPVPQAKPRQPQYLPDLTPEQQQSLWNMLLDNGMTALQYVGETLDKPGAALRGLLAGQPEELLNLVPFSDTMGLTNGPNSYAGERVTGRDLLETYGILGQNTPGLDWGDAAGFATEVVTDPLNLFLGTGAASKLIGKGGALVADDAAKAFGRAGQVIGSTPGRISEEIAEGSRGLFALRNPLPFMGHQKYIPPIATGPKAAALYDAAYYNPLVGGVRQLFSHNPLLRGAGKMLQKTADKEYATLLDEEARITDTITALSPKLDELREIYDGDLRQFLDNHPQKARIAELLVAEGADLSGVQDVDDLVRIMAEQRSALEIKSLADSMGPDTQGLRAVLEDANRPPEGPMPSGATIPPPIDPTTQARMLAKAETFDNFVRRMMTLKDDAAAEYWKLGGKITALTDDYARHYPRRAGLWELRTGSKADKLAKREAFWGAIQRTIRDIPGATFTMNQLSRDKNVVGKGLGAAGEALVPQGYIMDTYKQFAGAAPEDLDTLVKYLAQLPAEVADTGGIFNRGTLADNLDYSISASRSASALKALHSLFRQTATSDDIIGPTIREAVAKMGDSIDTERFINELALKGVQETQRVPEAFVATARKYMNYHRKPEEATGLLKYFDQAHALSKGLSYLPFAASHNRNFIGGQWQNLLTAYTTPKLGLKALAETFKIMRGQASEYLNELKYHGIGQASAMNDLTNNATGELLSSIPRVGVGETVGAVKDAFKGATNLRGISSIDNPLNPFNMRGAREGLKDGSTFALGKLGEQANHTVEFINQASHYIAQRMNGVTPGMAARNTKLAHFTEGNLSQFEQRVMTRLASFYRFSRGSLPHTLKLLVDNPGGNTARYLRIVNTARREEGEDNYIPSRLGEGLAFRMGGDEINTKFFTSTAITPQEESLNRFQFGAGGIPDAQRTLQKIAAMSNPLLQTVLEQMGGEQLWSGIPLEQLRDFPLEDMDNANYLIAKLPGSRFVSQAGKLTDDRKTVIDRAINLLMTGLTVTDVDMEREMNLEMQRIAKGRLSGQPGVGSYERPYVSDREKISEQDLILLSLLEQLGKAGREIRQERKALQAAE